MHRKSFYKIKIDLARSRGAYLYDQNRRQELLDLFGLYSSLPLGYNHPAFADAKFRNEILEAAGVKIPNNEMATDAGIEFLAAFSSHSSMKPFKYFHFTCTGALAIEAALKTAFDYRQPKGRPRLLSFKQSFHGINSYGGFITDRFGSVAARLDGFPGPFAEQLPNPVLRYEQGKPVVDAELRTKVLQMIEDGLKGDADRNIVGVLVEPIQCTAGDLVMDPSFLVALREICTRYDVPLIFDEVQTGYGGTGTLWYFEQLGFVPDIVAFGKKVQTSGIMAREPYHQIFDRPVRLEVTWDGDVLDMIRSRTILEAYQRLNILDNVKAQGAAFVEELKRFEPLKNLRQKGLLIAFDLEDRVQRDRFVAEMLAERAIVSSTQEKTVRFRPHLAISADERADALKRTKAVIERLRPAATAR